MTTEKPERDRAGDEPSTLAEPPPQPPVPVTEFSKRPGEQTEDERLLARDTEQHPETATTTDAWRVFRIMGESVAGFDTLARLGPSVSIFGSPLRRPHGPDYSGAP